MTIKGKAYIAGIYEHPTRHAPDKSTAQLHAEVAKGAIEDAGLTKADIDGYFCAGDAPGGAWPMVDYLGLKVRHIDSTDTGGCSYLIHLGHAAEAIAAGKCSIALVTLGGQAAHRPDAAARGRRRGRFRGGLWRHHPQCLRHVCHAPYARLRHHQRAARLDQGRGLASRPVQPARDAEGGRHRRGRAELADDLRSAAPHGLLRRHRRRRRDDRDHAGNRQEPEEAAGAADRPWRGDEGPARRQGSRPHLFRRRLVRPARLRGSGRHAEGHQVRLDL